MDPAEAERIKTAAFDEGYAAGYDHGSAAARREAEQLRTMARAASGVFDRFETELAPACWNWPSSSRARSSGANSPRTTT